MDNSSKEKLKNAICKLFERDKHLIEMNSHESSITAKLCCYLAAEFSEWDVDHEYNRKKDEPKLGAENNLIKPDIVIHKRGIKNNLFIIEIKKSSTGLDNADDEKLKHLTSNNEYEYRYGLHITIGMSEVKTIVYIRGGRDDDESTSLNQYLKEVHNYSKNPV